MSGTGGKALTIMICAVFIPNITFRTKRKKDNCWYFTRMRNARRVLGERETMGKDSSLPIELPVLLTEFATCTRTEDTGRYTLRVPGIFYLV